MNYLVKWEIEIDADSHREAAQEAKEIMLDPESEALYFIVDDGEEELGVNLMDPETWFPDYFPDADKKYEEGRDG